MTDAQETGLRTGVHMRGGGGGGGGSTQYGYCQYSSVYGDSSTAAQETGLRTGVNNSDADAAAFRGDER